MPIGGAIQLYGTNVQRFNEMEISDNRFFDQPRAGPKMVSDLPFEMSMLPVLSFKTSQKFPIS